VTADLNEMNYRSGRRDGGWALRVQYKGGQNSNLDISMWEDKFLTHTLDITII
jgi:hypothetical protein